MQGSTSLKARITAIANRKALEADVEQGAKIERLSKNYKVKKITMHFNSRRNGLEFTPPAKRRGASMMLFGEVVEVRKLPPKSPVHKRSDLGPFQHCLEVKARSGLTWYLVCRTEMDLTAWNSFFLFHVEKHRATQRQDPMTSFIETKWALATRQCPDSISFSEAVELLHKSFGYLPAAVVEERFRAFDQEKKVRLDFEVFCEFFKSFCQYPGLEPLFSMLVSNPALGMTREEFVRFLSLQGDLGEASSSPGCYSLFERESRTPSGTGRSDEPQRTSTFPRPTYAYSLFDSFGLAPNQCLSVEGFVEFLVSTSFNGVVDPRHHRCADAMNLPFCCYYINSSHNTYLTGDQLRSDSSTDRYRDVLLAGCRCVEIDCWNGPNGDPVVYHGHTATSKARFEDVIRVIGDYAFEPPAASSGHRPSAMADDGWNPRLFPVILSLEVHTSAAQSATMASILREVLGEKLLLPGDAFIAKGFTPANLKGKILVKWKANACNEDCPRDATGSGSSFDPAEEAPEHASRELGACVTIGSVRTKSWGTDAASATCVQSYVESTIEDYYANHPLEFAAQNTRMLSRVFPAGLRVNSSNYDPMLSWRLGAHMVALNLQTRDKYTAVNDGFFRYQNGGCGYVLKPSHLRVPQLKATTLRDASKPFALTVTLLCGAHLGEAYAGDRETIRHVHLWLHGSECDEYVSSAVVANSFHLAWNESVTLRGGHYDLDVLCVRLFASSSGGDTKKEVGEAALPVRVLRRGYRALPLNHPKTGFTFDYATIVCRIDVKMD